MRAVGPQLLWPADALVNLLLEAALACLELAGKLAPGRRSESENGTRSVPSVADDYAVTDGNLNTVGFVTPSNWT